MKGPDARNFLRQCSAEKESYASGLSACGVSYSMTGPVHRKHSNFRVVIIGVRRGVIVPSLDHRIWNQIEAVSVAAYPYLVIGPQGVRIYVEPEAWAFPPASRTVPYVKYSLVDLDHRLAHGTPLAAGRNSIENRPLHCTVAHSITLKPDGVATWEPSGGQ